MLSRAFLLFSSETKGETMAEPCEVQERAKKGASVLRLPVVNAERHSQQIELSMKLDILIKNTFKSFKTKINPGQPEEKRLTAPIRLFHRRIFHHAVSNASSILLIFKLLSASRSSARNNSGFNIISSAIKNWEKENLDNCFR